nr:PD-(D/E)XK nuclease family protein [Akkermansia sp. B2-R-115]
MHVGKAIHATLQSFNLARWRGEDYSEAAMEAAFCSHFLELEKTEGPVDYINEETRQKVRSCAWNTVKAYMDFDEVALQMPLGVEGGLSASIPGLPVPVRGVIDLVQHDLTAVDYKSAAAKPDTGHAAFDHELQLMEPNRPMTFPGAWKHRPSWIASTTKIPATGPTVSVFPDTTASILSETK